MPTRTPRKSQKLETYVDPEYLAQLLELKKTLHISSVSKLVRMMLEFSLHSFTLSATKKH